MLFKDIPEEARVGTGMGAWDTYTAATPLYLADCHFERRVKINVAGQQLQGQPFRVRLRLAWRLLRGKFLEYAPNIVVTRCVFTRADQTDEKPALELSYRDDPMQN